MPRFVDKPREDLIEGLRGLFGGYFHEDFDMEAPTEEGVARRFAKESRTSYVAQTLGFIDGLLGTDWTDEQLRTIVREAGSYCDVTLTGGSQREWLTMLRVAIADELAAKIDKDNSPD